MVFPDLTLTPKHAAVIRSSLVHIYNVVSMKPMILTQQSVAIKLFIRVKINAAEEKAMMTAKRSVVMIAFALEHISCVVRTRHTILLDIHAAQEKYTLELIHAVGITDIILALKRVAMARLQTGRTWNAVVMLALTLTQQFAVTEKFSQEKHTAVVTKAIIMAQRLVVMDISLMVVAWCAVEMLLIIHTLMLAVQGQSSIMHPTVAGM